MKHQAWPNLLSPFQSLSDMLLAPRRFLQQPHRYEEGLFWVVMAIMLGQFFLPSKADAFGPDVFMMAACGITSSILFFIAARFVGGRGDFETTFTATIMIFVVPTILSLYSIPLLMRIAENGLAPESETPMALLSLGLQCWLLVMQFLTLRDVHGLGPARAFFGLVVYFILLCLGLTIWAVMACVLVVPFISREGNLCAAATRSSSA